MLRARPGRAGWQRRRGAVGPAHDKPREGRDNLHGSQEGREEKGRKEALTAQPKS